MQCRSFAAQLGLQNETYQSVGANVLVILGDSLARAQQYAGSLHLPFPVLADPDRGVYHRFGLDKVMLMIQRTATVVIDQTGVIQYWKSATNPMTWLSESQELLEFIQKQDLQKI